MEEVVVIIVLEEQLVSVKGKDEDELSKNLEHMQCSRTYLLC